MTPEEYVQRLTETSTKKYKLLQDILSITKAQTQTMNDDGIDELERLIALKQVKIDEINKLDEQFNVYFLRIKQTLNVSSLDEIKGSTIPNIKGLQDVTGSIMSTIKEISNIEKNNSTSAKNLLNHFGNEVRKINQSKTVNQVYNAPPPVQPMSYYFDRKK